MTTDTLDYLPGNLVRARGREWVVQADRDAHDLPALGCAAPAAVIAAARGMRDGATRKPCRASTRSAAPRSA